MQLPCLLVKNILIRLILSTVSFLYQGDMQGVAHAAGDNDRRNVYPINIGTDAVTNTGRTQHSKIVNSSRIHFIHMYIIMSSLPFSRELYCLLKKMISSCHGKLDRYVYPCKGSVRISFNYLTCPFHHWCIYPLLFSLYAARVAFKSLWILICVVAFAYYCCSLVNKQQTIQKSLDLQKRQLTQIGKYPRRKLFDFIVAQVPVRISFIISTPFLMTLKMITEKQPYPSLFQFYRCCLLLQY